MSSLVTLEKTRAFKNELACYITEPVRLRVMSTMTSGTLPFRALRFSTKDHPILVKRLSKEMFLNFGKGRIFSWMEPG